MNTTPDAISLTPPELTALPSTLTGVFAALPLLPGTSPLLSPLATSGVRGKQPATVGVYVDGVELPAGFHLLLGPPVLQDAQVGKLTFHRGPGPIEHGRHLGGALTVDLSGPTAPGLSSASSVDLLRAGTLHHWMTPDGGTQVSAGASLAWAPWLYTRVAGSGGPEWDPSRAGLRADLGDYYARAEHRVGGGALRLLALGSVDAVASAGDQDLIGAGLSFHRIDLRGRHPLWGGEAQARLTFGLDRVHAELGGSHVQSSALLTQTTFAARAGWGTALGNVGRLRAGVDLTRKAVDLAQLWEIRAPQLEGAPPGEPLQAGVRTPLANALLTGAFIAATLSDDPAWSWDLGLRVDNYHLAPGRDLLAVEPRVAVRRALSEDVAFDASIARVHQAPTFLLPLPGVDTAALRYGLQEALRVNAGLQVRMAPHTTGRLDVYVDPLTRTVELSPFDRDFLQTVKASPGQEGAPKPSSGYAFGAELLLRREWADGLFGWISWSWQRSLREVHYPVRNDFGEPVGEALATLPALHVQEHAATVVAGKTFGRWTLSGAARFHTGAPEQGSLLYSNTQREGLDRLRPGPKWIEADRIDAAWLPPFFRLDARVAYAFRLGPVDLSASLDLQNLTVGREVTKYSYGDEADSLLDRDAGRITLTRAPGGILPALPLPMLGLSARY